MSVNKGRSAPLPPNRFAFGGGTKPLSEITFNKYDRDKNGSISRDELRSLCYDMGYYLSDDELAWAWTIVDKDGSGHVDYREFADWWKTSSRFDHLKILDDQQMTFVCRLVEIFRSKDTTNRGSLDHTQFVALCQALIDDGMIDANAHQACQFEEIDIGHDGRIHFNELIAWLKNVGLLNNDNAAS